ncbi:target of Nesh-SH3 isoform X2 [Leuresthes tenuis]|uniref:target of Nesh-SH3 isoform X2 n=1 Tax=Leuresthes tenuis TaxID=355514 RepID=UPI003B507C46
MQQHSRSFLVLLLIAFIAGIGFSGPSTSHRSRVRRQNMKVRISATGDTIVMKFLRPNTDTKLEGYILGYGSSMFSKQFIQLPENNGQPYETEFDAEPKYLIAVQPIPTNEVKKQCAGKVELEKPLHLVIGSVTPTSVLLSWGTLLKTPYEGNVMNDCLEDGHYMVRYREKNRKWNYQTCPTSDTVIDKLKPNTVYEFGVQPNSKDGSGVWSKPVVHNISMASIEERVVRKIYKRPVNSGKPSTPGLHSFPFSPQHVPQNRTRGRQPIPRNIVPQTTLAPSTAARQEFLPTLGPKLPVANKKQPIGGGELSRSILPPFMEVPLTPKPLTPKFHPQVHITATVAPAPVYLEKHGGHSQKKPQTHLRTQPQSNSKHQEQYQAPQTKPQPLQPPPQLHRQSIQQLHTTSQPELNTKPQTQAISQSTQHTHLLSKLKSTQLHQSHPQTTPLFQSTPKPQPIPQTIHQVLLPAQLQLKTYKEPPAQIQPVPQPTPLFQDQTTRPTPQHISHMQEAPRKFHPKPQPQTQYQPKTPQTQPQITQKKPEPKIVFANSEPKAQPKPKNQADPQLQPKPKKLLKPSTNPIIREWKQYQPNVQPHPQPQPPPKLQFQPELLPHPESSAQPQPRPRLRQLPQTRIQSDRSKGTPRKAVPMAPSPLEEGKPIPRPALATEKADSYNHGTGVVRSSIAEVPHSPISSSVPTAERNATRPRIQTLPHSTNVGVRPFSPSKTATSSHNSNTPGANGVHHRGNALHKPVVWSKEKPAVLHTPVPSNKRPNLVGNPSDHDKPMDLKQGGKESILKPFTLVTAKPKQDHRQQTTTAVPAVNSSRFDINENSSIFRPLPASEVDIMGKKRFVAPHVIYKTDKKPDEPCSITSSLAYFPDEEASDQNVTGPPRTAPSNLTVVTVEGCPSFVILDWEKTDNETTEYEVISTTTGPNGQEVSILTTNQTHTAVENLTPESSYEFKVTPKNELGSGPSSDPVTFSTESADPRVSEHASGKDAIWTQFPFKSDAYSECNGKQFVKRTWYRKFVGIQLCNSLRYKIYLSDSLTGKFYNIGDQTGYGEDHCQFVDSFLDGRTGTQMLADQLPSRSGFFRAMRQEPVSFGEIGGKSHATYVGWYECGTPIPGKW